MELFGFIVGLFGLVVMAMIAVPLLYILFVAVRIVINQIHKTSDAILKKK